jgi:pyruvate-ferredoxin/flavodoxin oxidoreductase
MSNQANGNLRYKTIDANEAVASVAFRLSEVIAIYPITPSSPMGEWSDDWAARNIKNLWGTVPSVVELQSEGGAAGAIHGALQTGSLATTFTASQGLLLMIPNMYKIAGELTPAVFHIAARSLAYQALSIFGDHSDVMSTRSTGWAMLCSNSVQETADCAAIAHAATLESRIPFLHFFDGFRTSHEVQKIAEIPNEVLSQMICEKRIAEFRARALSPDHPVLRGTAQNPDVYFQGRETVNKFYDATPEIVEKAMEKFAKLTGRAYKLFEYVGAPDADRVIILMGSGCEAAHETVDALTAKGEKVGVLKVRLYRPFSASHFLAALPKTVKTIAVLDRTKESGAPGEPLYMDCVQSLFEAASTGRLPFAKMPAVIAGRYGLSSKEFTPAMVKGVFDNLAKPAPKNHFTIGINDDLSGTSIDYDPSFSTEGNDVVRALFFGLGADGTVGANKDSIKIIGEHTNNWAQGYFVYDSKKSGAATVSHLRFGPREIRSTYLVYQANFIGLHQPALLERYDILKAAAPGSTFLMNTVHSAGEVWEKLPARMQKHILEKKVRFFVIDAFKVAKETGMGGRINTIMQVCFFALANVLPKEEAIGYIKSAIKKSYGKKGEEIVAMNIRAVDAALEHMHEVNVDGRKINGLPFRAPVSEKAPEYVRNVLGKIMMGDGDEVKVSEMPVDGTFPTATTQWEKRNIALDAPVWDPAVCIQCGKCILVCPHACIRTKVYDPALLAGAPKTFKSSDARLPEWKGQKFTIQVSTEDCTGCGVCVDVCPARNKSEAKLKAINMRPLGEGQADDIKNWDFFFNSIPDMDRKRVSTNNLRSMQVMRPLFEFSGACGGCGETPYVKLLSQLFGDRLAIANATGCSSIYGGNLPTTPWAKDANGRGPAWSNSLFEDNAEFGLGYRVSIDKQTEFARELLKQVSSIVGDALVSKILGNPQTTETEIQDQRQAVVEVKQKLQGSDAPAAKQLLNLADMLVRKSVWILGGDGWAYDIGYGGLDHVMASGRNVNILVLDTEVYSNTGGQASKSTPRAAVARFAAKGKGLPKKDLGMIAMSYGYVYVARVAMGASDAQVLKAFLEADAYDGPSLIIAYSHCIQQGIDMRKGLDQQRLAVQSGMWPLYRFNPDLVAEGKSPLTIDSKDPSVPVETYAYNETRYRMLLQSDEARAETLMREAKDDVQKRWELYRHLAEVYTPHNDAGKPE